MEYALLRYICFFKLSKANRKLKENTFLLRSALLPVFDWLQNTYLLWVWHAAVTLFLVTAIGWQVLTRCRHQVPGTRYQMRTEEASLPGPTSEKTVYLLSSHSLSGFHRHLSCNSPGQWKAFSESSRAHSRCYPHL